MADLLPWWELPVVVRRSKRHLYEYIRTGELPVMDGGESVTPEPTPEPEPDSEPDVDPEPGDD